MVSLLWYGISTLYKKRCQVVCPPLSLSFSPLYEDTVRKQQFAMSKRAFTRARTFWHPDIKYPSSGIIPILWYCNEFFKKCSSLKESSGILPQGNYGFTLLSRLCRLNDNNHNPSLKLCIYLSPIASQSPWIFINRK